MRFYRAIVAIGVWFVFTVASIAIPATIVGFTVVGNIIAFGVAGNLGFGGAALVLRGSLGWFYILLLRLGSLL